MIRKAVIPAAGLGTRFLPATKSMPKEMLPLIDMPIIQFVVEEAIASGIEDIIIITGRGKRYDAGDKLGYVKAIIDSALEREDLKEEMERHLRRNMEKRKGGDYMRYIVELEELSADVLENLKKNSRIIHIFSVIDNTIALETENVERIKELRGVRRVYESGKAKLMLHDALNIIGILDVHNRGSYGDDVWIGVIDSGIDISDPLVSGSIILERDFTEEGMYDPIGHGTIMVRILKVVAPNISFINAKVVDRTGEADEIDIMRAIEWCTNSGADVMNLSLGIPRKCDGSCPLCELVNIASERVIIVAAAGNNGPEEDSVSCPANSKSCIGVGSMEKDGTVSNYSSRGSPDHLKPDIIAPGCISYGNFELEGTSIATPFVSASAALLLSVDDSDKRRTIDDILGTAEDKGFPKWLQGQRLIRPDKALEVILCD